MKRLEMECQARYRLRDNQRVLDRAWARNSLLFVGDDGLGSMRDLLVWPVMANELTWHPVAGFGRSLARRDMKLRIKGDSLRLRVTRSELVRLRSEGRVEETIHFGLGEESVLIYGLEQGQSNINISVQCGARRLTILLSTEAAARWAEGEDTGIYGESEIVDGVLTLAVEKDFACLEGNEADNGDTFPNPNVVVAC
jgi:hypothetical protein